MESAATEKDGIVINADMQPLENDSKVLALTIRR